jgi:hypothetical protein
VTRVHPVPYSIDVAGSSPKELKLPGHETDHWPASSSKIKNCGTISPRKMPSSGKLCHAALVIADVSEERIAYIIKMTCTSISSQHVLVACYC